MLKPGLLVKVTLTLLVLASLYWLARVGVADFIRLRPCAYIDSLGKGSVQLDPVTLDQSRELLLLARTWDPGNPVVPEYLAQTDFILAQMLNFNPALQADFLRKAIVNFDLAIALRPNSAYLWAARMTTGDWLLQLNRKLALPVDRVELARVELSLKRAAILDPWNPSVLRQIVTVGKLRLLDFEPESRLQVEEAITRAKQMGVNI